jgi:thioredoxin-related protein
MNVTGIKGRREKASLNMTRSAARKIILSFMTLLSFMVARAQSTETRLAQFDITLINNEKFKSFQLKKNQPVILMYFSPECDHCKDLTKEIIKNGKSIATKQLIMITYFPVADVKKFANDLSIQKYPNIKVGTEGMTLIVQRHYNIRNFPFIVLYDKNGKLVKMFREQAPPADIVKAMQQV